MTSRKRRAILVPTVRVTALLVAAGLLAGCGDSGGDADRADEPTPTAEASMTPSPDPSASGGPRSPVVEQAVKDVAGRLSVPAETVEVVSEEEVTWRDGSMGCAEPDMSYTQALVDGSRVVLRVDGTDYEYHAGGSSPPFYCEKPTE